MPRVRLAPSRTTAKASGNSLSSDSPAATRCLNSKVLPRRPSSSSFSYSDSSALMRETVLESWRSTRSLRLPKRLVRARLNIDLPSVKAEGPRRPRAKGDMLLQPLQLAGMAAEGGGFKRVERRPAREPAGARLRLRQSASARPGVPPERGLLKAGYGLSGGSSRRPAD